MIKEKKAVIQLLIGGKYWRNLNTYYFNDSEAYITTSVEYFKLSEAKTIMEAYKIIHKQEQFRLVVKLENIKDGNND